MELLRQNIQAKQAQATTAAGSTESKAFASCVEGATVVDTNELLEVYANFLEAHATHTCRLM